MNPGQQSGEHAAVIDQGGSSAKNLVGSELGSSLGEVLVVPLFKSFFNECFRAMPDGRDPFSNREPRAKTWKPELTIALIGIEPDSKITDGHGRQTAFLATS